MIPVKKQVQDYCDDLVFHYVHAFTTLQTSEHVDTRMCGDVWDIVWDEVRFKVSDKVRYYHD